MGHKAIAATSKDVRNWFAKNPNKVPAGAEVSVQVSCKGRISASAIEAFNKASKTHGMKYAEGNEKVIALPYKAGNNRMVVMHKPVSQVRKAAGKAGVRGPLSKRDLDFATEVFLAAK